ncbi:hypothetical protein PSQ19_10870 [Devosia algicola]|uniref:Glycosyl hydrolase family 4 C-terminal domain-containing protein n=1 Tax=Devosia algicola TaxID=3026418 RepID=A0ABY7YSM7_9HYPH|nr:hypothetical protein [Devosia algicola]WDR04301.1 hypothetical protein PSQ19_10870 [Devosia algicola]
MPEETFTSFGIGLNHLTFLTRLRTGGQDAVPLLHAKLDEQSGVVQSELDHKTIWDNTVVNRAPRWSDDPFSWGLFREKSVFPCAMDRHAVEFYPERFPGGAYHGHLLGREAFPIDARIGLGDTWYDEMLAIANSPDPLPREYYENVPGESEQLLEIMHSLLYDQRGVFSVNLPNTGQAPYLPMHAILECNASAVAGGFAALQADALDAELVSKLSAKIDAIEMTVDAAIKGSRDLMVQAMLADGTVTDSDVAAKLADDLIADHRRHLPQFS